MITRREMNSTLASSLVALFSGAVASIPAAAAPRQQSASGNTSPIKPPAIPYLMQESIGDIGDAEASMLILNIPPANPAARRPFVMHKHSGPVFAYVLEGSVENQVDPQEKPQTYNTGDYWYEHAMHVHRFLRNLSDTQRARILIFEMLPKGKPAAYRVEK